MLTIHAITICFGAPAFPELMLSIQQQVAKKYCISLHGSTSRYCTVVFFILYTAFPWKAILETLTGESSAMGCSFYSCHRVTTSLCTFDTAEKRCLPSELLKNSFPVPLQVLIFLSSLSASVLPRRKQHMLERGSGVVPSGGTRLAASPHARSRVCTTSIPPSTEHHGSWRQAALAVLSLAQGTSLGISVWVKREYASLMVSLLQDGHHSVFAAPPSHDQLPTGCT